MRTVLVLNSKGGCGKSTVAVNLAGYYASRGIVPALMDYDPQGSTLHWLRLRGEADADGGRRTPIHGINACRSRTGMTRAWQMHVPPETGRIIIDAPAGTTGAALQEMLRRTDAIIIPVTPSPIDIHATSEFIKELLLVGKVRSQGIHVGVIANRVRRDTPQYEPLKRFLVSLNIPFITSLTDTERYIIAAETGQGIHEMDEAETVLEREQWYPLIQWLNDPTRNLDQLEARPRLNLVTGSGG